MSRTVREFNEAIRRQQQAEGIIQHRSDCPARNSSDNPCICLWPNVETVSSSPEISLSEMHDLLTGEAPDSIIRERHETHGDFSKVAKTAMELREVMQQAGAKLTAGQAEALTMICTKIARILHGDPNFSDHWKDIAGYAALAERSCKESGK